MEDKHGDSTILFSGPVAPQGKAAPGKHALVILSGAEIGVEFRLDPGAGPVVLGRNADCPALLHAPSVSRRHARVDWKPDLDNGKFVLSDTGSSNGTYINDAPAKGTPLCDGDRVRMGDVLLKYVEQDEVDAQFHEEVRRRIHYDDLTGLMTMKAFHRRLDAAIAHGQAAHPFSLAMTDLDGLKRVNDCYGHLAGRMVVREMGAMIRESLRPQDIPALYGGDEAVLLFPETPLDEALAVSECLRQRIEGRRFEFGGHAFHVSISQGLAEWPAHGATAEALIAAADGALYAAKRAGRNCVRTAAGNI